LLATSGGRRRPQPPCPGRRSSSLVMWAEQQAIDATDRNKVKEFEAL
jgi:hypothetical protein